MTILITGIVLLISGFFAPYLSRGTLPGHFLFWAGFLLILRAVESTSSRPLIARWARRVMLCHVAGAVLFLLFSTLIFMGEELRHDYLVDVFFEVCAIILTPVDTIYNYLFPPVFTRQADGSVHWQVSFFKATLLSFLNILFYVVIGGLIGYIIQKEEDRWSGYKAMRSGQGK